MSLTGSACAFAGDSQRIWNGYTDHKFRVKGSDRCLRCPEIPSPPPPLPFESLRANG
jgi:hypothetical protein